MGAALVDKYQRQAEKSRSEARRARQRIAQLQGNVNSAEREQSQQEQQAAETQVSSSDQIQTALNSQLDQFGQVSQQNRQRQCAACSSDADVARFTAECEGGGQAACYRAAAAVCACKANAGGCGNYLPTLQACVRDNTQKANTFHSNSPTIQWQRQIAFKISRPQAESK